MMRRPFARVVAVAVALACPAVGHACAVCFSGSPKVRLAFFNTTLLLTLLPLALIVGGLWWLRRTGRVVLADEFEESDYSAGEGAAPAGRAP